MEGWKGGRMEEDLLEALLQRTMRGSASFKSFQPHRDHRVLRASFSLLPVKWSKFSSAACLSGLILEPNGLARWPWWMNHRPMSAVYL